MFRSLRQRFKLKDKDKPRVNLKHLAHYILVQIAYIDNQYDIYKAIKAKNKKYLVRIYQTLDKRNVIGLAQLQQERLGETLNR